MRRVACVTLAMLAPLTATTVGAQADSLSSVAACPVSEGFGLTLDASTGAPDPRDTTRTASRGARLSLDTTYVFDVAERRWSLPRLDASLGAGAVGSTASGAHWHACAGARVGLREPTLVVRGARGTVRLRLSLDPLAAATGDGPRTTPRR